METLKDISWANYLTVMGAVVTAYYLIVLALFFRKQLARLLKRPEQLASEELVDDNDGEPMNELETLVNDIECNILVAGTGHTKEELWRLLEERVATFGWLNRAGYRYALNNFIIEKAKGNCGVEFSEEELEARWEALLR